MVQWASPAIKRDFVISLKYFEVVEYLAFEHFLEYHAVSVVTPLMNGLSSSSDRVAAQSAALQGSNWPKGPDTHKISMRKKCLFSMPSNSLAC